MRILTITSPDINNGLGNRVTLWVAGCSHHCPGCHNAWTWNYNQGFDISTEENKEKLVNMLASELEKPYIDGLTLSGGDPLSQDEDSLNDLYFILTVITIRFPNKNIWIWAGDTFEEILKHPKKKKIIEMCNVLVDGEFKQELKDLTIPYRGSTNQRIIDVKRSLLENKTIEFKINEEFKDYR